jgi:hypothetical protein
MVRLSGEGSGVLGAGGNLLGVAKSQGYFPNSFGIAGNPFSQDFQIPGKKPSGQPVLPGENKKGIEDVYGRPGPQPMPGTFPLGLPMAMGTPVVGNMGGMIAMKNAGFFAGPQLGQFNQGVPAGFQNKYVS